MAKSKAIAAVRYFEERLKAKSVHISKIVLFGSCTRATQVILKQARLSPAAEVTVDFALDRTRTWLSIIRKDDDLKERGIRVSEEIKQIRRETLGW